MPAGCARTTGKFRPNVERVISQIASRGGRRLSFPLPRHRQEQRLGLQTAPPPSTCATSSTGACTRDDGTWVLA